MNRPLIKGTPIHKASIAKAKAESIVAQTRTQADSSLVGAGDTLGKSYIPLDIDYSMDLKAVKIPKSKKKKKKNNETEKQDIDFRGEEILMDENQLTNRPIVTEQPGDTANEISAGGAQYGFDYSQPQVASPKTVGGNKDKIKAEKQAKINAENLKKDNQKAKDKKAKDKQAAKDKKAKDKEAKRLKDIQMNKKKGQVYEPGSIKADAVGGKQISQYTKEQRDRLASEGAWSDDVGKMVLPEEIVDGKFVSKAEGTNLEVVATDPKGDNQTNNTVVEEADQNKTTTRTREQKENDKIYNDFRTSNYKKRKMIERGYTPIQSKSPMEMRDDRIYINARANGPVRENMIKGGYKPQ